MKREPRTRAHAVQSRIVRTRTRAHVCASGHHSIHARRCTRDEYIHIHMSDPCMPYIYRRAHTHAHDVAGHIVGARNRTHIHMDAMQPRARSQPVHHTSIHLSIEIRPVYPAYRYKPIYPHGEIYTRARALERTGLRGHALVCTACPNRWCVQRR